MTRQIRAAKVYQTASAHLATMTFEGFPLPPLEAIAPPWYRVVEQIPPAEILTRTAAVQHGGGALHRRQRRPRNVFRPTRLVYPEDRLRRAFYRDHPWELARPKMLVELDGKDARDRDWSTGLVQPGMALSGESVVQRQLYLMETDPTMTQERAYDVVRREFYRLRQEEQIERRVAREEATHYGAYFGMTGVRVGAQLEDEQYERWKAWAAAEIDRVKAERDSAYTSFEDNVKVDRDEIAGPDADDGLGLPPPALDGEAAAAVGGKEAVSSVL